MNREETLESLAGCTVKEAKAEVIEGTEEDSAYEQLIFTLADGRTVFIIPVDDQELNLVIK